MIYTCMAGGPVAETRLRWGSLAETGPKVPVWEDERPREPKLLRESAEIRARGGRSPWMWISRQSRLSAFGLQGGTLQVRCHRLAARVERRGWRGVRKGRPRREKRSPESREEPIFATFLEARHYWRIGPECLHCAYLIQMDP
jgi:hypothetical protein